MSLSIWVACWVLWGRDLGFDVYANHELLYSEDLSLSARLWVTSVVAIGLSAVLILIVRFTLYLVTGVPVFGRRSSSTRSAPKV